MKLFLMTCMLKMSCVHVKPLEVHVVALATVTLVTGTENHIAE